MYIFCRTSAVVRAIPHIAVYFSSLPSGAKIVEKNQFTFDEVITDCVMSCFSGPQYMTTGKTEVIRRLLRLNFSSAAWTC